MLTSVLSSGSCSIPSYLVFYKRYTDNPSVPNKSGPDIYTKFGSDEDEVREVMRSDFWILIVLSLRNKVRKVNVRVALLTLHVPRFPQITLSLTCQLPPIDGPRRLHVGGKP